MNAAGVGATVESCERIFVLPLLPPAVVEAVMTDAVALEWERARVATPEHLDGIVDVNLRSADIRAEEPTIACFNVLRRAMEHALRPMLSVNGTSLAISELNLVRYRSGQFQAQHRDADPALKSDRRYSIVCYLSNACEGGETLFPSLGLEVKPQVGSAVIFPSFFLHAASPVRSGEKIVAVGFISDKSEKA